MNSVRWLQWISWISLFCGVFLVFFSAYVEVFLKKDISIFFMAGSIAMLALSGFLMSLSAKLEMRPSSQGKNKRGKDNKGDCK